MEAHKGRADLPAEIERLCGATIARAGDRVLQPESPRAMAASGWHKRSDEPLRHEHP